jgi:hypothetical protein
MISPKQGEVLGYFDETDVDSVVSFQLVAVDGGGEQKIVETLHIHILPTQVNDLEQQVLDAEAKADEAKATAKATTTISAAVVGGVLFMLVAVVAGIKYRQHVIAMRCGARFSTEICTR